MKSLLALLFFLVSINLSLAQNTSSFEIVMSTDNLKLNPGEEFQIKLYISGYATFLKETKLAIYPDGGIKFHNISIPQAGYAPAINPTIMIISGFASAFRSILENERLSIATEIAEPFIINAYIDSNDRGGDYTISSVFTYNDGDNWKTTKSTFDIHVNNFYEQFEYIIQLLALIGFPALFILVILKGVGTLKKVLSCLKKSNLPVSTSRTFLSSEA